MEPEGDARTEREVTPAVDPFDESPQAPADPVGGIEAWQEERANAARGTRQRVRFERLPPGFPIDLLRRARAQPDRRWRHSDVDDVSARWFADRPLDLHLMREAPLGSPSLWRAINRAIARADPVTDEQIAWRIRGRDVDFVDRARDADQPLSDECLAQAARNRRLLLERLITDWRPPPTA